MNQETVRELKRHLNPGGPWKIAGIVCLALALLCAVLLPLLIGWLVLAGLCFWRYAAAGKKLTAALEADMVRDYTAAISMFDGELWVGNRYLFGRNHGRVVAYEDIRQVYQDVQKTYIFETSRCLKYKNAAGKAFTLCKLPLRDRARDDVMKVMVFIHGKNPAAKLGYK
ncbi:MAG: hypothetical protein J6B95_03945 [Oscillospiraceae bacterium]|nr:hypothetical protein [Oscillospiraceae bacterium]